MIISGEALLSLLQRALLNQDAGKGFQVDMVLDDNAADLKEDNTCHESTE